MVNFYVEIIPTILLIGSVTPGTEISLSEFVRGDVTGFKGVWTYSVARQPVAKNIISGREISFQVRDEKEPTESKIFVCCRILLAKRKRRQSNEIKDCQVTD